MKRRHPYGAVASLCVGFFFVATAVSPQQSTNRPHVGVPQDWSQRHIIFSRDALLQHPDVISREPRVFYQAMQRWQGANSNIRRRFNPAPALPLQSNPQDWNVLLRGRIAANMFPAKYSFDPAAAADCANDYVVFGTTNIGLVPPATGGNANLVAFNNLYSGAGGGLCAAAPTLMFAYNITTVAGGHIVTSPVLSADGTKIAFVESAGNPVPQAIFHVLTWAREGSLLNAAVPNMTSTPFATVNSVTSSPWVDYGTDTAYMGANDGRIYKITGVFKGTPTLAGAPWPVLLRLNTHPTPPVLDNRLGMLMVGGTDGFLYQVNTADGTVKSLVVGLRGGGRVNPGILGAPIVDVTNGTTFAVSSNDGTSGVLVEANTQTLGEMARANIGQASVSGTAVDLYQPAFSDSYYTNPGTGVVRLCGTGAADITPWQYAFGFNGTTMQTTPMPTFPKQLVNSTTASCTGWTEFFNPNINGGTDFFFFGLTSDCTAPGAPGGCVVSLTSDTALATANVSGGPSGIVVDNFSTAAEASSIYLMARGANRAYKFKQTLLP